MPWSLEKEFLVMLGGNTFVDSPNLVTYEDAPLFELKRNSESGYLGISFKIYDEDGSKLATVGNNSLFPNKKYKGPKRFAIEGKVHDWALREIASGFLVCGLKKKEKALPVELQLTVNLYTPNGALFSATPESILVPDNKSFSGNIFKNAGIHLRKDGSLSIG